MYNIDGIQTYSYIHHVYTFFFFVRRTGVTGGSGVLRTLRLRWDRRTVGVSETVDSLSELLLCCCLKVGSGS